MSHTSPISPRHRSASALVLIAVAFFSVAAVTAALFITPGLQSHGSPPTPLANRIVPVSTPTSTTAPAAVVVTGTSTAAPQPTSAGASQATIEYTTESGKGSQEGPVNSLLRISVRIPTQPGAHPETDAPANVSLQLLDDKGQPAQYGAHLPFRSSPCHVPGNGTGPLVRQRLDTRAPRHLPSSRGHGHP